MIPFAYQFLKLGWDGGIDDHVVLPTLRAVYEFVRAGHPANDSGLCVTAWYPDGGHHTIKLNTDIFRSRKVLDMRALRAEAKKLIEEDARDKAEFMKGTSGMTTGSPWLCDMGEDAVIADLKAEREWSWRDPEHIPWEEVESNFNHIYHKTKG